MDKELPPVSFRPLLEIPNIPTHPVRGQVFRHFRHATFIGILVFQKFESICLGHPRGSRPSFSSPDKISGIPNRKRRPFTEGWGVSVISIQAHGTQFGKARSVDELFRASFNASAKPAHGLNPRGVKPNVWPAASPNRHSMQVRISCESRKGASTSRV